MVADHLSDEECRKLSSALYQDGFTLDDTLPSHANHNYSVCIKYLLLWDRSHGQGKTCHHLALRLHQIGRRDLAITLTDSIHAEEKEILDKTYLNDPFKDKLPKDSTLLASDEVPKKEKLEDTNKQLSGWEIFSIVAGAVTAIAIVVMLVYKVFGEVIKRMFKQYAPEFVIQWLDLVYGEGRWFCKKSKRMFETKVIGKTKKKPDLRTLMEMNKNLNNSLLAW